MCCTWCGSGASPLTEKLLALAGPVVSVRTALRTSEARTAETVSTPPVPVDTTVDTLVARTAASQPDTVETNLETTPHRCCSPCNNLCKWI